MVPDPRYRCLIPVSAFGEPDGPKRVDDSTWFPIPEWPVFALAGFCRTTPEWGAVYAAMTGDSNELVKPLNERSPIILAPDEYDRWLTALDPGGNRIPVPPAIPGRAHANGTKRGASGAPQRAQQQATQEGVTSPCAISTPFERVYDEVARHFGVAPRPRFRTCRPRPIRARQGLSFASRTASACCSPWAGAFRSGSNS